MEPGDVVVARKVAREAYDLCLRTRRKSQDLGMVVNGDLDGEADVKKVRPQEATKLLTQTRKRQKLKSIKTKFEWAYLTKVEFEELIERFIELVADLEKMTPTQPLQDIADQDTIDLGIKTVRKILESIGINDKPRDKPLQKALDRTVALAGSVFHNDFSGIQNDGGLVSGQTNITGETVNFGKTHTRQ